MRDSRFTVERVELTTVEVPYRDRIAEHMRKEITHWQYVDVVRIELAGGAVGYGESMPFFWSGPVTDEAIERTRGENAAEMLWDDSLGVGVQMALFDAVARTAGIPVHRLLGRQVRDRVPLSWWCISMPPEDWVTEAETAVERGYTSIKLKGRPWFDIREAIDRVCAAVPDWFQVDIDFNETLLDAERAIPLLEEFETYPQVNIYESPLPQTDIDGNRMLRETVDTDIAMHYGRPAPLTTLSEELCDGFVVIGSPNECLRANAVAREGGLPFFLQLVGTGITAAFCMHLGAVLEGATWPGITCHQIYENDLLVGPIAVDDGHATVPDGPGLGYEVDATAVANRAVKRPDSRPEPPRLLEVSWPNGRTKYFSGYDGQLMAAAQDGDISFYERGVQTRFVPDDGSDWWRDLHERALDEPIAEE